MSHRKISLVLAASALLYAAVGQTQENKIAMVPVKYDGLKQEILKQRGKVVLVDFWASFCPPCRKAFPQFIGMHKKYADKGLSVISVSVDAADNVESVEGANAFLRQVDSPFRNLLLHEPAEIWTKKLEFVSLPCYYVFDRQGKWVRFGGAESDKAINYDELEKVVVRMLNEK